MASWFAMRLVGIQIIALTMGGTLWATFEPGPMMDIEGRGIMSDRQTQSQHDDAQHERHVSAGVQSQSDTTSVPSQAVGMDVLSRLSALPNSSMTHTVRQNAVLRMQQTMGNAATCRKIEHLKSSGGWFNHKAVQPRVTSSGGSLPVQIFRLLPLRSISHSLREATAFETTFGGRCGNGSSVYQHQYVSISSEMVVLATWG